VVGFIYYHKAVFGNAWARMLGIEMNPENMKKEMPKVMLVSYIVNFFLAFGLASIVIHQMGLFSLLMANKGDLSNLDYVTKIVVSYDGVPVDADVLWNGLFRTFKHGAMHGAMAGLTIVMPILVTLGLYEKRPMKLVFINVGYWVINLALMGGFICQMLRFS
jgi:hypothetical protein